MNGHGSHCLYCFRDSNKEIVLDAALSAKVDANELEKEYKSVMEEYFNPQKNKEQLKEFFCKI